MSNIFIIIVCYNGMSWLAKTLASIPVNYPIVIIDNNSTDCTVKFIQENYPNAIIFPQEKNLGFGQANNIGISHALKGGAEHIFLLNQDAYLKDNCLDGLIDFQEKNEEYGILSPIHLDGTGTRLDAKFSNYVNYSGNKDFFSDYVLNKKRKEVYQVPFVNAAGWLLSRECIEKVGGFDPIFFHYGEDDNFCQRVLFHKFKIGVVPTSFLLHDRQKRNNKEIQIHLNQFEKKEIELKVKYANINNPYDNKLEILMKNRKRFTLLSYLKLKLKDAKFYHNEYVFLRDLVPKIKESRKTNTDAGNSYL